MVDQRIHHASGQGVLLVDEHPYEHAGGAAVGHLGEAQQARGRVVRGHRDLGQHAADDGRLPQRAALGLNQRKQDALVEGSGLEKSLCDMKLCYARLLS